MRNILKLSVYATLIICNMSLFAENNEGELEKAYMLGAFHTSEQLQRNFKVQGINKSKIQFNKFIVAIDISSLPTYKLLIYQQIGYTESLTPVVVNDKYLVFNSYERKADALYLQEKVLNSFHFKTKEEKAILLENNEPNSWYKSPFVQKELFDVLVEEVNKNVKAKVYVVKEDNGALDRKLDALEEMNRKQSIPIKEPLFETKIPVKKEVIPVVVLKNEKMKKGVEIPSSLQKFKLNSYVTMSIYTGNRNAPILSQDKFIPAREASVLVSDNYKFATIKKDDEGREWVKLYTENIWIERRDIEILN